MKNKKEFTFPECSSGSLGAERTLELHSALCAPFGVSLCFIRSSQLCCGQEGVEVDSETFSVCLQNTFSVWEQGKRGFAVILWKLEVSCGRFHAGVFVACPAAGTCAVLDLQRQSESRSRAVSSVSPALPLCSGPNTSPSDEPLSPACRGAGQQSHCFLLGSNAEGCAEWSKPCPVQRERSLPEKLEAMFGRAIRVSQANIPAVGS